MSTDDKWLDIGHVEGDLAHLPGGYHSFEDFNESASYGLEHRRSVSIDLTEKAVQQLLEVLEEAKQQSEILDNIKRLFKPLPYID